MITENENKNFPKYESKRPVFILRKVGQYWGDGSTGYVSGRFNDITDDRFKVMLPPRVHTFSAFLKNMETIACAKFRNTNIISKLVKPIQLFLII